MARESVTGYGFRRILPEKPEERACGVATPRKLRLYDRCLWCSKPLTGRSHQIYCSVSCREAAYKARCRAKRLERKTWGDPHSAGDGAEELARVFSEYKLCVARLAATDRQDALGQACRSLANLSKDAMRELGI